MKHLYTLLACFFAALTATAQQRTLEQAAELARQYSATLLPVSGQQLALELGQRRSPEARKRLMPSFAVADSQPFYIFAGEDGQGFVIVAGDQRMGDVLGYSDTAPFGLSQMPDGMAALLDFYAQAYMAARTAYAPAGDRQRRAVQWKAVSPMCVSKWGQGTPYNVQCPLLDGRRTLVGCGAVAMAQVMKHYAYPTKGTGSWAYTTETAGLADSFNFGTTTFQWGNMANSYGSGASATAVATLLHACGVSIGMDYGLTWSNSYTIDIPYALIHYFNYSESANCYCRDYFSDEAWETIVCNELQAHRPLIYRGADPDDNGGHIFVVDGCDSRGRLHVNWGWYGNSDGYFEMEGLLPPGGDDYRFGHWLIKGISPEPTGEHEDVFQADRFTVEVDDDIISGQLQYVWCYANCTNHLDETKTYQGYMGMGLFTLEGEEALILDAYRVNLRCMWGYNEFNMASAYYPMALPDGTYQLRPFVMDQDSNISFIHTGGGATDCYYLTQEDGEVKLSDQLPDGIATPVAEPTLRSTGIFTLDGRPAPSLRAPGIYLHRGRKTVFRR